MQPNNDWAVTIAGPPAPDFIYKNGRGEKFFLTLTGKIYPESELKRWAPKFKGLPVYDSHLTLAESVNGRGDLVLTTIDPRDYRGQRLGFIKKTGYFEKHHELRAILTITDDKWQEAIFEAMCTGALSEIGLSMTPSIYTGTKKLRIAEGVYVPVVEIMGIFSVDIVDEPFFGGRFLNADKNERWIESARQWKKQNIGANYDQR